MAFTLGAAIVKASGGSSSTTLSTTHSLTTGRGLIVGVTWFKSSAAPTISSITCTSESNLTLIGTPQAQPQSGSSSIKYSQLAYLNGAIANTGSKTITVTMSEAIDNSDRLQMFSMEVVGGDMSNFLDTSSRAGSAGATTGPATTSLTTTLDNALLVAISGNSLEHAAAGSTFTGTTITPTGSHFTDIEYKLDAGAAGSQTIPFAAYSGAAFWGISAAAFNFLGPIIINASNTAPMATLNAGAWYADLTAAMPTLGADDGWQAVNTAPMPTMASEMGFSVDMTAPMPTLDAVGQAGDYAVITAPMPTLESEMGPEGGFIDLTAPMPTLSATGFAGTVLTFEEIAPMPTMESGTKDFNEIAPMPTVAASLVGGEVGTASMVAPMPTLSAIGFQREILEIELVAQMPSLDATLLAGNVLTAAMVAPVPLLTASGFLGALATVSLTAPMPTISALAYGAYTITFSNTAPMPYLSAELSALLATIYRAWVMNARNRALTEYDNFQFNSFARFNGKILGASPTGIMSLDESADDNGVDIDALLRTGQQTLGTPYLKRVPRIYFSGSSDGDLEFRTIATGEGTRSYLLPFNGAEDDQQRRVPVGKGPKAYRWSYEVANRFGADFQVNAITVYPTPLRRRIR